MRKIIEELQINKHNELSETGITYPEKFCACKYVGKLTHNKYLYVNWKEHAHSTSQQHTTYRKIQVDQQTLYRYLYIHKLLHKFSSCI